MAPEALLSHVRVKLGRLRDPVWDLTASKGRIRMAMLYQRLNLVMMILGTMAGTLTGGELLLYASRSGFWSLLMTWPPQIQCIGIQAIPLLECHDQIAFNPTNLSSSQHNIVMP